MQKLIRQLGFGNAGLIAIAVTFGLALLLAGYQTWTITWERGLEELSSRARHDLELRAENLRGYLARFRMVPELIASSGRMPVFAMNKILSCNCSAAHCHDLP